MKIRVQIDEKYYEVEVGDLSANPVTTLVDGELIKVWLEASAAPAAAPAPVMKAPALAPVQAAAPTSAPRPASAPASSDKSKQVVAPIPGTILSINVKEGQEVSFGQELATLEAMKMKSAIRSHRAGKIAVIRVAAGDRVSQNQALMDYAD